ncbi:hypothetical protein [Flavobacterium lindanitolerans]|jgi:hypothetical protein|uniref:hypothetical protein n=1 Tax=Flavobacterium lindanitolerans TaxID=428988 RepID=UPI0028086A01|nr:hypothetical protein [Flavobacterium lindanitolerans]MDQ7961633.1 hypothetical protein [Flavobacterium lindanitolerans]
MEIISKAIDGDEILIRYLYLNDFKKNQLDPEKLIEKDVYVDTRDEGVSLQREKYISENDCKILAKNIPRKYVGFMLFKKSVFEKLLEEHKTLRAEFEAEINASPLDENNKKINSDIEVTTDTPGQPAHADLEYINPAIIEEDTSTHTFSRIFSKNLCRQSVILLDQNIEEVNFIGCTFKELF